VEPFTSNDTYACPDCGSEVRVGARSCPGCGPFRPVDWEENDEDAAGHSRPASPFHSITTYTDTRDVLEKSRRPVFNLPHVEEKQTRLTRTLLIVLIGLVAVTVAMSAIQVLLR